MKAPKRLTRSHREGGFTIIELMIATAVLSILLVMVTVMMVSIGKLYYKGINQARIQDNVRSLSDEVARHLQLGDNFFHVTSGSEEAYCVGSTRYTFILYKQIGSNGGAPDYQYPHVLWRDKNPTPGSCPSALPNLAANPPSAGGAELVAPHSRLTGFSITSTAGTSPYTIGIGEAYGDNDLICVTTAPGCASDGVQSAVAALISGGGSAPINTIKCKGRTGDQFCATASLTTTVVRRLP